MNRTVRRATAAALSLACLTPAPSAQASTGTYATLWASSHPSSPGVYTLFIHGAFKAANKDVATQWAHKADWTVDIRIWGDDTVYDDVLKNLRRSVTIKQNTVYFETQVDMPASALDEDYGKDEVYFEARLLEDDGNWASDFARVKSNNITNHY